MEFETMETPETRSQFELRFHYLMNMVKQEKFHVSAHISIYGLVKVRHLPNGRIDFLSVNEQARLSANQMYHMRNFKLPDNIDPDE